MAWVNRGIGAITRKASATKATSATLNGSLVTEEETTEWWFAYGTKPSQGISGYPDKTTVKSISGEADVDVNQAVSGLSPDTTYYTRMFVRNQDGEVAEGNEIEYSTYGRPVAAYSFDENEGEVAADLAGEHHGALENTEWVKGRYGSAIFLDGTNDYVEIPDSPELALTEEFTLEAWVRPDGFADEGVVISKEVDGNHSYQLYGASREEGGVPEGFLGYDTEPFVWEDVEDEENPLQPKVWNHLALTFDGAYLRLYVNGELADTEFSPPALAGEGPLLIGGNGDEEFFQGRIDEVRVYDRALDASALAADKATPVQELLG